MRGRKDAERASPRPVRCAIYTRKSTDENLDAEFNSLDAQRESAEAYIASQRHEGWAALPTRYDDGGFSGGTLERPGLRRLLDDVEADRIDCVVVYKVDRLSRSLLDFARLIEVFDRRNVSFVSITQQFNTTTSMGRLVLNILLSFAQFEREIIGERIRDKVAATKRKGMYTGGPPVLGYDVDRERKRLVVNPEEAELVRHIFARFVDTSCITGLVEELNAQGYATKSWTTKQGVTRAGKPWNKGYIYRLLNNPLYIGEVAHKDQRYPGEHEAIISSELWEQAHVILAKRYRARGAHLRTQGPALLRGIIRCAHCDCAMGPVFTRRRRVYRYYLCQHASRNGHRTCPTRSLSAGEIEEVVVQQVRRLLRSPQLLVGACQGAATVRKRDMTRALAALGETWDQLPPGEQERIVRSVVTRADIHPDRADLQFSKEGMVALIAEMNDQRGAREVAA
jgi:DNA invertase Pin-like site-specific DNA recombinase